MPPKQPRKKLAQLLWLAAFFGVVWYQAGLTLAIWIVVAGASGYALQFHLVGALVSRFSSRHVEPRRWLIGAAGAVGCAATIAAGLGALVLLAWGIWAIVHALIHIRPKLT